MLNRIYGFILAMLSLAAFAWLACVSLGYVTGVLWKAFMLGFMSV